MPNEETDSVVVKLSSGYNVGIDKKKVKKIEKIGAGKKLGISSARKVKKNPKLPNITILHTQESLSMTEHWEWALSHAKGEWRIFVGQDDGLHIVWLPIR